MQTNLVTQLKILSTVEVISSIEYTLVIFTYPILKFWGSIYLYKEGWGGGGGGERFSIYITTGKSRGIFCSFPILNSREY
jgi:hypothetical protein